MMIPKLDFSNLGGGVGGGVGGGGGGGATLLPTVDQRAAATTNPEEEEEEDEEEGEEGEEEKAIVGEAGGERTPMGLPRRGANDKRAAAVVKSSPNGKENASVRSDTMDVRTPVFRKGRESLKGGRESVGSRHRRRVMIYRPSLAPAGTPGQPVNLLAAAEESERAGVSGGGEPGSSGSLGSAGESRGRASSIGSAGGADTADRQLWGNTTFDHLAEEYTNPGSPRTPEDLARAFKRGDGGGPGTLNLHQLQKCLGAYISEWRGGDTCDGGGVGRGAGILVRVTMNVDVGQSVD